MSLDLAQYVYLARSGLNGQVYLGGAGAFDSMIVAGVFAVLLAEIIGEVRERMQGGPSSSGRPEALLNQLRSGGKEKDKEGL
jgi:hypothetical protein